MEDSLNINNGNTSYINTTDNKKRIQIIGHIAPIDLCKKLSTLTFR